MPKRGICRISDCGTEIGLRYDAAYAHETTIFLRRRSRPFFSMMVIRSARHWNGW